MEQKREPKMLQVNAVDSGQGHLKINIKKQGFSDHEAIGVLEMAKNQVMGMIKAKVDKSTAFSPNKDKRDEY